MYNLFLGNINDVICVLYVICYMGVTESCVTKPGERSMSVSAMMGWSSGEWMAT